MRRLRFRRQETLKSFDTPYELLQLHVLVLDAHASDLIALDRLANPARLLDNTLTLHVIIQPSRNLLPHSVFIKIMLST